MPRKKARRPLHQPLPRPNIDKAKRAAWESQADLDKQIIPNPEEYLSTTEAWARATPEKFESMFAQLQDQARIVGYLRIVPEIDGQGSHWMLKFTRGRWSGYYLYFFQRPQDPARMACLFLMRQFAEVQSGSRKPAKDTPWGA